MKFLKSLRFRLILLVLMAVIPAMGIILFSGIQQRQMARKNAQEDAFRLTHQIINYHSSLIEGGRQMLLSLTLSPQIFEKDRCDALLKELVAISPIYSNISVARSDGIIYCSAVDLPNPDISLKDRPYFQNALQRGEFVVGDITIGSVTQKTILPLSMPAYDKNRKTALVITASIDMGQVIQYTQQLKLPPDSAMLFVNLEGTILMRYPESTQLVGQTLPQVPIIQEILSTFGEGFAEVPGVDQVTRLYAFTPFTPGNQETTYVSVGVPSTVAYEQADQILRQGITWLGLSAVIALAAAWFGGEIFFLRVVSLTAERDEAERKLRNINKELENRVAERTAELAHTNELLQGELTERKRTVLILTQREAEMQKLLQAVERSNRDLQDFAYIASHDLQEPLRKIQAFGERLVKQYGPQLGEQGLNYAQRMNNSANRLQTMINDLLAYSRVNTKGNDFKPIQLDDVLEEVLSNLELRIRETGGKVVACPLPVVEADSTQMTQVFQNLIGNALKFHRPDVPPVIEIRAEEIASTENSHPGEVIITIEDNGIGFDEKYLDRIFLPFQRLHSREQYEGSGIGLAICRKIIERHGGCIKASSTPSVGSRFSLHIPQKHLPDQRGIV